jgi:hypothetical protein
MTHTLTVAEIAMIKILLTVLLFAAPALAQDQAAFAAAGCGPDKVKFDVKAYDHPPASVAVQPGKALVYAFEDISRSNFGFGGVTTKFGLDGTWVGANLDNSYFVFSVDPGDHSLCTSWQSSIASRSKLHAAASLTAEAGKSYYFRTVVFYNTDGKYPPTLKLEPVDPAEGRLLIASSPFSTSQPKK